MRYRSVWWFLALALSARGGELNLDFSAGPENQTPTNFHSALAGRGRPGDWKIIWDEVPPLLAPLTPQAPAVSRRAVLAQLSQDPTDERFPMLIFDGETFGDFTLTTRFKLAGGGLEQMAGIAFRMQDERNFYVIRASGLGSNLRFYKVVNGERGNLIGPEIPIPKGIWHDLKIECKGNQIRAWLNGNEAIPPLMDSTFTSGKIGFWTKSDSVSYFADTHITYTRRVPLMQGIVRDMVAKYPRLLGLQVFTLDDKAQPRLVASKNEKDLGEAGTDVEKKVIADGRVYYGTGKDFVSVVLPLRDRNGDAMAAVRVKLTTFPGQTEQTAVVRATPIVKEMQTQAQALEEPNQ